MTKTNAVVAALAVAAFGCWYAFAACGRSVETPRRGPAPCVLCYHTCPKANVGSAAMIAFIRSGQCESIDVRCETGTEGANCTAWLD